MVGHVGEMRWLLLVVMSGCLLEVDNEPPPLPSDLEGTYEVSDWVAQEPDCSGPSVGAVSPYAVFEVALEEVYGVDALVLRPCTGPGNCDGGLATEVVFFETWDDEKATGTLRTA